MNMKNIMGMLDELSVATISAPSSRSRRVISLMDLLDENNINFQFNNCDSIAIYKAHLLKMYDLFKIEMAVLSTVDKLIIIETLHQIKTRISEISVLLNPKNDDLLYAHVCIPKSKRILRDQNQAPLLKKKYCFTWMSKVKFYA